MPNGNEKPIVAETNARKILKEAEPSDLFRIATCLQVLWAKYYLRLNDF